LHRGSNPETGQTPSLAHSSSRSGACDDLETLSRHAEQMDRSYLAMQRLAVAIMQDQFRPLADVVVNFESCKIVGPSCSLVEQKNWWSKKTSRVVLAVVVVVVVLVLAASVVVVVVVMVLAVVVVVVVVLTVFAVAVAVVVAFWWAWFPQHWGCLGGKAKGQWQIHEGCHDCTTCIN
jgi:hypothetical protein